jgi:ubiquitin C-terminal hydrolase
VQCLIKDCNADVKCESRIVELPQVLMLNFGRFKQRENKPTFKCENQISFDTELDLKDYLDEDYYDDEGTTKYELYAIGLHVGDTFGGHLMSVCKNSINNKYYHFNDNDVKQIDIKLKMKEYNRQA